MIKKYYDDVRIADLLEEYNITLRGNVSLVSTFPPVMLDNIYCLHCNTNMHRKRHAKSSQAYTSKPYCTKCGCRYVNDSEIVSCNCVACLRIKNEFTKNINETKRSSLNLLIKEGLEDPYVEIQDIDLTEGIYLLTTIRGLANENMEYLQPLDSATTPIAPTTNFSITILKH